MFILGIGKLFHHQQDESAETIGQQVEEQTEISQDAEKELSYQKKTSKQEEAAQRRGEFTGSVYTGQKAAAQAEKDAAEAAKPSMRTVTSPL